MGEEGKGCGQRIVVCHSIQNRVSQANQPGIDEQVSAVRRDSYGMDLGTNRKRLLL